MVDVTDPNFAETFWATPDDGWYFQKWNSGDRFFCGDSTDTECTLSFRGHEDSQLVKDMVASSETIYLMPVFAEVTDIIEVDGKEWLQPLLFRNLSWNDIDAVCSHQTGLCSGFLNGYDITGWTWASVTDVNDLFNYYFGSEILGPGPDTKTLIGPEGGSDSRPILDGWVPTGKEGLSSWGPAMRVIYGWTRNALNDGSDQALSAFWGKNYTYEEVLVLTTNRIDWKSSGWIYRAAWFYRIP
jgi:hypothetical protein